MEDDYSDDDTDLEYEILQSFFDRGFSYYKESKWENAELFLRRGLDTAMKLPPDKLRQKNIRLGEAQFKFAICVFHQCKFEDAEVALLPLRTARPTTDETNEIVMRRILAIHAYAILCFRKNQFDEARRHCRIALSMKRKHFDKDMYYLDSAYFDFLYEVAKWGNDPLTAEVCYKKSREFDSRPSETSRLGSEFAMAALGNLLNLCIGQRLETDGTEPHKVGVTVRPSVTVKPSTVQTDMTSSDEGPKYYIE